MTLVFKIYPILDVKRNESGSLYKAACVKQGIEIKKNIYLSWTEEVHLYSNFLSGRLVH